MRSKIKGGRGTMCVLERTRRGRQERRKSLQADYAKTELERPRGARACPPLVLAMGALKGGSLGPGRSPEQDR